MVLRSSLGKGKAPASGFLGEPPFPRSLPLPVLLLSMLGPWGPDSLGLSALVPHQRGEDRGTRGLFRGAQERNTGCGGKAAAAPRRKMKRGGEGRPSFHRRMRGFWRRWFRAHFWQYTGRSVLGSNGSSSIRAPQSAQVRFKCRTSYILRGPLCISASFLPRENSCRRGT